ncbi:MAG: hypothetical protein R3Y43_05710 [Alphaproteobacteria bacterium]
MTSIRKERFAKLQSEITKMTRNSFIVNARWLNIKSLFIVESFEDVSLCEKVMYFRRNSLRPVEVLNCHDGQFVGGKETAELLSREYGGTVEATNYKDVFTWKHPERKEKKSYDYTHDVIIDFEEAYNFLNM